jgi:hypothetical protein
MRLPEHGKTERTLVTYHSEAERRLAQAADSGVELSTVTAELEREGVASCRRSRSRAQSVSGARGGVRSAYWVACS